MTIGGTGMQKIINPAFVKPQERNPTPLQQPEYFRREVKSYEAIHLAYELSSDAKRKSLHWLMKADYPEHVHATITRIYRVKVIPGMVEDENSNVLPADKTLKDCIVYSLNEYVDNPEYVSKGGASGVEILSGDHYSEGFYKKHIGRFDYDERGNLANSTHLGTRYMFYIPYSPQAIRDLLRKYDHDRTLLLACRIGNDNTSASEPYIGSPKTVKNIDEFCNIEDIDGLIAANEGAPGFGTFLSEKRGGYERYRKWKQKLDEEGPDTAISALDKVAAAEPTAPKKRQYRPPATQLLVRRTFRAIRY